LVNNTVPAIDRALNVLELLAQSRKGFTISEISRRLELPKSSVHLIMNTLEKRGYLKKNQQTGKYRFGMKFISLSRSSIEGLELRAEARPYLEALMRQTLLTVHMVILEHDEAVIIEKVEPPGLLQLATWVGRRMDVHCTGAGKALIAFISDDELDRRIKSRGLARHNKRTICSFRNLKAELIRVRECGYAFDDEEDEIGLRCIGAPVFGFNDEVLAAISIAGTTTQMSDDKVLKLAEQVKQAAASISAHLGNSKAI
jgi:DNA-binding IclR family transcriptional regulator